MGNTLANQCRELRVAPTNSYQHILIIELVAHFGITMATMPECAFLRPVVGLVEEPAAMRVSLDYFQALI